MATRADIHDPGPFGTALKAARAGRRVSQLMLSLDAGVSARHLSFLESGRAKGMVSAWKEGRPCL
jgi:transcriptional regulator with XRE-family HTH domain